MARDEFGLDRAREDALRASALSVRDHERHDYSGWWRRVGAYLIDVVLLLVAFFVILWVGLAINDAVAVVLVIVWLLAVFLGYWVFFEGSESGQTLGKRALGIRVRNDDGGRASYGQALGRNLVARLIGAIPIVGLIDVLWPLWDADNQCLHDKAASTIVVRT